MTKGEQLRLMEETGVVAVIRTQDGGELVSICEALVAGGVLAVEITMTSPGALEAIYQASKVLGGKAIIGAGSVLDGETARAALLAGADFLVSPVLRQDVITMAKRYGKIVIPGAFSPTEILTAWEAGADVVKVFPATKLGPEFFKDIRGPLPQVKLTPTGGVNLGNLGQFLQAGAVFVGVGSALVNRDIVARRDWAALSVLAAQYIAAVKQARAV
ncbi:MAG: bifunctional 4-hydroxy-2-oxoglutarate aldolase/2-dehydro-3-deoxy-phosphogluconate aldolase [Limnochordia bacterium]|nr:bifunctional 4-hydroxy-2-oxoglutarate aldolase/2-dehydro-3-deoxy-phosphogluconate aldolase [Limnochordia bacterium]MDI9466247.1 bifunctional 4-hydroxy-2-oxoglutarate aldolase/2-dehydro-3-deoxy-phosphogluconate aldolase [Bacillota bacterium]NLO95458.1 bifunctional 4-hydroxy-2-oxoglutarate aldolase/2-dehydro-3-deoxy-phosphogluconate aldolase [Bacillota bacterium]HAN95336.1 2-dehydro-3-deoxyphosphogluconate aldolase [Bacillota bacterium]HOB40139.1 bifunctional 4-hydroxy-2-oxoglutarate aldolase/